MVEPIAFPASAGPLDALGPVRPVKAETPVADRAPAPVKTGRKPAVESQPTTRLMIEEGKGGAFIYTVLDSESGLVLARIPRQEVALLSQNESYFAGAVVDAKA